MNTRSKVLLALGVAGIGTLSAAPSFAAPGQAYASGSATIVLMNGASMSAGIEVGAPGSSQFPGGSNGIYTVTPNVGGALNTNNAVISNVVLNVGLPTAGAGNTSFTAEAAAKLNAATTLDAQVSIIRAGAGVDGLD